MNIELSIGLLLIGAFASYVLYPAFYDVAFPLQIIACLITDESGDDPKPKSNQEKPKEKKALKGNAILVDGEFGDKYLISGTPPRCRKI
jgi:hypothetical protein